MLVLLHFGNIQYIEYFLADIFVSCKKKVVFKFYFLLTSLTWLYSTELNITHSISGVLSCNSDFSLYRVYWAATQISPYIGCTELRLRLLLISGVLNCDSDCSLYQVYWTATQTSPSSFITYVLPCYDPGCWLVDIYIEICFTTAKWMFGLIFPNTSFWW